MNELVDRLTAEFADKDYAHAYMEEHGNMALAAQIKTLREQRGLTQAQLAELAGMRQERICALENVEYDAWSAKTLQKLAQAFDTSLQISFVPFSSAIISAVNVSRKTLEVPSREEDLGNFRQHRIVESKGSWAVIDGTMTTAQTIRNPIGKKFEQASGSDTVLQVKCWQGDIKIERCT